MAFAINPSQGYLERLNCLVSSPATLAAAGYVMKELTDEELESRKRCLTCGGRVKKNGRGGGSQPGRDRGTPANRCRFHPGKLDRQSMEWSCCGLTAHAPPCVTREFHDPPHGSEAIKKRWQFYRTPAEKKPTHRIAVAIDCEMGIAEDEESELIRVTLVDFFSGEALIDKLVLPHVRLKSFSTAFSGVTKADMEAARRSNQCFRGKDAAREAVLEFVGPQTIVVGHSAGGDFSSLRWIYNRIIDTLVIEAARRKQLEDLTDQMNALSVGATEESNDPFDDAATVRNTKNIARGRGHRTFNPDGLSLKALTLKRLGREIQLGNNGHDSLEDAIAPRNLVDYLVTSMC